jgi:tetratricopeptide (TPR) repeat protein
MQKKRPSIFTKFFIVAILALACSFTVSILVWLCNSLYDKFQPDLHWLPFIFCILAGVLIFLFSIFSYYLMPSLNWVVLPRRVVWATLFIYWLSVVILFIPIVYAFVLHFSTGKILPWAMVTLTVLLFAVYCLTEQFSIRASGRWMILRPVRLILYQRFIILGGLIPRLEKGWHAIAVKMIDVLLAVWLVQTMARIIWQAAAYRGLLNIAYTERLLSPTYPLNGSIFTGFSESYQSTLMALDYSGHNFALDLVSSIFSLLWQHWEQIVVIWFLLEVIGFFWGSSGKLVIVDASRSDAASSNKNEDGEKADSNDMQLSESSPADLLAMKLDRINQIYSTVDEKRPIQSACGAGEPIDATIKVDRLDDISLSSTSQISLGPLGVPASSIYTLISHILRGPKIIIGIYCKENSKELGAADGDKDKRFLTARMSGKMGSKSWLVDSPDPLEEDSSNSARTIDDMITEMAHRIYASQESETTGQSIPWRAMWNFNEGLRAYRDCLHTTKKRKLFLNRAEKKFIDALEEHSSFSLAYYNLGVVYAELGQSDSAEACFQMAIDTDPELLETYYALGIAIFKRSKDIEQQFEILNIPVPHTKKNGIIDDYGKVIELCQRVLEIESSKEGELKNDFSIKARAYDLMGNAQARLARWKCPAIKNGEACTTEQANEASCTGIPVCLGLAKECLEKSVYYSWLALIKESVLHETSEDASKIVSECTQDLADLYLKMSNCMRCIGGELRFCARSELMQAIYVNPHEVKLYHQLAKASKSKESSDFAKLVYDYALRIKPESSRLKAHQASLKANHTGPVVWLEECEKLGCCDEETHEKIYHFLNSAIKEYDYSKNKEYQAREFCYKWEKLEADLSKLSSKGESAISALREKEKVCKENGIRECHKISLTLCRLAKDVGNKSIFDESLQNALSEMMILYNLEDEPNVLLLNKFNEEVLQLMDDLSVLGSLHLESNLVKNDEYDLEQTKKCFCAVYWILNNNLLIENNPSRIFYKLAVPYCMVEAGKKLLELGMTRQFPKRKSEKCFSRAKRLFEQAIKALEDADQEYIKRNKIRMYLAKACMACMEPHAALKEAQKARDLNPLDYEERMVLGDIFCELKEFNFGLKEMNIALSFRPDDPDILLRTGRAYFLAGKDCKKKGEDRFNILKKAKDNLHEALEIEDKSSIKKRGKIRYWIGKTLLEMGKYEEAIPHLRILAKKEDGNSLPALFLGYAYLKSNAHYECENCLYELINEHHNPNIDRFCGWEYEDEMHINEIMARACIYLAYSYVERDAGLESAWMLAFDSQKYIENMKEKDYSWGSRPEYAEMDRSFKISFPEIDYSLSVPVPNGPELPDLADFSLIKIESKKHFFDESLAGQIAGYEIKIKCDDRDGPRKRKIKAHLAECAGTIFCKMSKIKRAIDFLNISISLYPDAGAYLNLAKAFDIKLLQGEAIESEKALIRRKILDICQHVEGLDMKNEYIEDLREFKKRYQSEEDDSEGNEEASKSKPSKRGV